MTLIEHLTLVEETRSDINRKHDLVDVMFLVISAIISGAEGRRRSDPKAGKPC
ncbi:transposase [Aeromonas hydrophila]|nr:transposase IS4 family protein [Aeromonas hydrophila ML09-119]OLO00978.1 transposase [Aeromonas hydrophila]